MFSIPKVDVYLCWSFYVKGIPGIKNYSTTIESFCKKSLGTQNTDYKIVAQL